MNSTVKKAVSVALATATCLTTMVCSAFAASPTFKDVPETHWAYSNIEQAVEDGIVKGMSPGVFSPATQVTSAQFFAMVERVCMPYAAYEDPDVPWYEPYWHMASSTTYNLLTNTAITKENFNKGISRYDMAQVLYNYNNISEVGDPYGYGGLYGITAASPSQIKDYGSIPGKYRDAVLWAYGAGALKGDEAGKFNGSKVMNRAEAATVMVRMEEIIKACDQAEKDANMKAVLEHSKTSLYDSHEKATYSDGRTYTKEYVELLKQNAKDGLRVTGNVYFDEGTYEIPATINFRNENPERKLSHIKFTVYVMEPYKQDQGLNYQRKWIPACEYVFDENSNLKDNSGTFTFLITANTFLGEYDSSVKVRIVVEDCYDLSNNCAEDLEGFEIPFDVKMCVDPTNYLWRSTF